MKSKQTEVTPTSQTAEIFSAEGPLASIIIPSYNHARYVSEAIRSVLAQDYKNFEIIVIDDGSTDDTRQVVEPFGNQVHYIYQQNQGLSAARNTGINAARGEYIGVLDADDLYEPAFLSNLITILTANPDADGVYCGYQFVDENNNPLFEQQTRSFPPEKLFEILVDSNPFVPESMFLKSRCYKEAGLFDVSLRACEDWDMWLRVSKRFQIIGTPTVLTRHRVLSGSMSSNPTRMFNNRLAVVRKHFGSEPQTEQDWSSINRLAYGGAYRISTIEYLQYKDAEKANECFRKMACVNPQLLVELNTFYELGCGEQPKGSRGEFTSLDLAQNADVTLRMLEKLYSEKVLANEVRVIKSTAFAIANFALGLLAYGRGNLSQARRYLFKAISLDLKIGLKKKLVFTLIKTFLGSRFLNWLRQKRRHQDQNIGKQV